MNRNQRILILALLCACFSMTRLTLCGQQKMFSRTYGNHAYNQGVAAFQLQDSSYVVVGNTSGFQGHTSPYLFRMDTDGNLLSDAVITRPWLIQVTASVLSGNYLFLTGYAFRQGDYDFMLMKTTVGGTVVFEKYWGGNGWDFARDIMVNGTHMYICGESADTIFGEMDAALMCLDSTGTLIWQNRYGGNGYDAFYAVDTGHAQTLIAAGTSNSYNASGDSAFYFISTDLSGNPLWETVEDYPGLDVAYDIHPDIMGGYFLCGQTAFWQGFDLEAFLMHLDATGAVEWKTQLGSANDAGFYCAIQLPDSTFRMAGFNCGIFSGGKSDFYLQNADIYGVWNPSYGDLTIGGPAEDVAFHLIHTMDGGFLMTGTSRSYGAGISNIYIVKTDHQAQSQPYSGHIIAVGERATATAPALFRIYPNPVMDYLKISALHPTAMGTQWVEVFDLTGRLLGSSELHFNNDPVQTLPTGALHPGVYLLRIGNETFRFLKR